MSLTPYAILERKRDGAALSAEEIAAVVRGATDGGWSEGQLGAFLMAVAIHGLEPEETRALTFEMLASGEQWALDREVAGLADKHSTGGVGDKVSLVLSPLLAACDQPVVMLTGRGLGHTGGTADKLEIIPGLDLALDRRRCLELLAAEGMAIGMATADVAPADRRLYALRDVTGTVESLPLITASILSKKLATGASGIVFDVKTGNGAFMHDLADARALAHMLVDTSARLGYSASAWITDMSQPLGDWVGHAAEIRETLECLRGEGPENLMEVVYALSQEAARLAGSELDRGRLEAAVASGAALARFESWVAAQGGDVGRLAAASGELAPVELVVEAPVGGFLAAVATKRLGLLLAEAGGGRVRPGDAIDAGVSLRYRARLGRAVAAGDELARVYLRREDAALAAAFDGCFTVAEEPPAVPDLLRERILPDP